MVLKRIFLIISTVLLLAILGACSPEGDQSRLFSDLNRPEVLATGLPSPAPPRVLSICLGDEPDSLFLYGDLSTSAQIIRQAIYDSPVDLVDFRASSVLLTTLPSWENELVFLQQVEVYPGDRIVDAQGNITLLTSGVEYRPAGCASRDCWTTFENQASIQLDQVQISYKMQEGILWFDGEPLTAADSVFSYQVALEIYGTSGSAKTRYTNSYELVEEQGLFWKGLPGYLGIYDYTEQFFAPLPEHLWSNLSREELLTSAQTTQMPLGWGAYRVVEWVRGDHISLVKNPNYHASSQGLPTYDSLVFRFVDGGEDALAAFASGECAIVIKEQDLFNYLPEIDSLVRSGAANRIVYDLPSWEQISFGVNSLDPSRNLLPDPRTRQAIASCINREEIAAQRADAGTWVDNLFHPNDPRSDPELDPRVFQPQEGVKLLEELGWVDHDQDSATPRISRGVDNLANDVAFQLTLLEGRSEGASQTALLIKDQLSRCGIEVTIESLLPGDLFAHGPEGPVFGRKFDLALFSWSTGNYQLCKIFTTSEIPGQYPRYAKGWGGTNATGFSQAEYDQACEYLLTSLSGTGESLEETNHIQAIFQEELPVLPLFFRQDLILVNPAVGEIHPGTYHPLWNIEYFQ